MRSIANMICKEVSMFEDEFKKINGFFPDCIEFSPEKKGYIASDLSSSSKQVETAMNIGLASWCMSIGRDYIDVNYKEEKTVACSCYHGRVVDGWGRDLGTCRTCNGTGFYQKKESYF